MLFGALVGALISFVAGQTLQRILFDAFQRAAPREIATDRVAVVLIDPFSLATVGGWPWPRYYLARLTEQIAKQKPKAIGFDIIFPEEDRFNPEHFAALYPELPSSEQSDINELPSMDSMFAQTLGAAPTVLGRLGMHNKGSDPGSLMADPLVEGKPPRDTLRFPQVLSSIPELDDVASSHAMLNGSPDSDGIVRSVPLTVMAGSRAFPGFAAELARISAGLDSMRWSGDRLMLGSRAIPAGADGRLRLRFGEFPRQAAYPASLLLERNASPDSVSRSIITPDAFTGKVVIIGLAAEGSADLVATPLATEGYGVFVQAQAVDAILKGGWLQRPLWMVAAEWLTGAALTLLVLLAALTRRWWLLIAAIAAAALPFASWTAFDQSNLLFDPLRPLTIFAGAALALLALLFVRARAERERLAAALIEQRIASARQEGELQAARSIQLGMVPGPDRLSKLDERVEISGQLDPARSVGGDFYDASKIEDDQLLLVIGDVTGKGIPAALYMALSKGLAKSVLTRKGGGLAEAVTALNHELLRDADESMGVTMLIVILDCTSGELAMVNAGHENPIIRKANGEAHSVAMKGGPPFCVCDFPYQEESTRLEPGDTLVLITDGVTEAENARGEFFGVSGAIAALTKTAGETAEKTATNLSVRVRMFEGETEPSDDLTVLVARLKTLKS